MSETTLPTWIKGGLIYRCDNDFFFKSHVTRPIPLLIDKDRLRLFFSSRDDNDIPFPNFIDVDPNNPKRVLYINKLPMMTLGRPGTFDDSGITPVSILTKGVDCPLLYYVGWKRRRYGVTIETSIGVARLTNDFNSMQRIFEGPIMGQDRHHPLLVAAPFVVPDYEGFRMWYCSATEWCQTPDGPEMIYTIYSACSRDGLTWGCFSSDPVVHYLYSGEVVSAPWVVKLADGRMLMWYSTRGSANRYDKKYMAGIAISCDGKSWRRHDNDVGITRSETGWDSEMICYPAVFNYHDTTYMFYSGNGVGRGGIGYAIASNRLDIVEW